MLVRISHPEFGPQKTWLASNVAANAITSTVENTQGFATDTFVVFGSPGAERAEIVRLTGVTAPSTLAHSPGPVFAHSANEFITQTRFDKIEVYRATTEAGSYSLVATIDIDIDWYETVYEDVNGDTTSWYKIRYKNSIDDEVSEYSNAVQGSGYTEESLYSMQEEAMEEFGDKEGRVITRHQWRRIARAGTRILARALVQLASPVLTTKATTSWTTGDDVTTLPDRFLKFRVVRVQYSGGEAKRARPINEEDVDPNATYSTSNPYFFRRGSSWGILPDQTATITRWQDVFPEVMTDVTDEHGLPYGARDAIVAYMLYRAWIRKDKDRARLYQGEFSGLSREYVQQVAEGFQGFESSTLRVDVEGLSDDDEYY